MTLIIMLGLYFIVVKVEQQLLPNRPGKRSYMAPILVLYAVHIMCIVHVCFISIVYIHFYSIQSGSTDQGVEGGGKIWYS